MGFLVLCYGSTEDPFVYSVVKFRFIREQEATRELKIFVSGQKIVLIQSSCFGTCVACFKFCDFCRNLKMKNNFLFYPDPDSVTLFVSVFPTHSPAAAYAINFCRERMGNFHLCRIAFYTD